MSLIAEGNPTVIQGLFLCHYLERSGESFSCLSNQCILALCDHPCEMNHSLCFDCVKDLEIEHFTNITILESSVFLQTFIFSHIDFNHKILLRFCVTILS